MKCITGEPLTRLDSGKLRRRKPLTEHLLIPPENPLKNIETFVTVEAETS